jgi:hypothetical protein
MKASDVIKCLKTRFSGPEWAFATELALVPGFSDRRADAVAMNCFPAAKFGCAVFGFEIKVSRSDFLHELKHPNKRMETYAGVDALFLAVPAGLIDKEEVPLDMGLITCKEGSARISRMPEGFKSPRELATFDRQYKEGGYIFKEIKMHKMPPLQRGLAISLLRAFESGRDRDLVAAKAEIWTLKETIKKIKYKIESMRNNHEGLT